MQKKSGLCDLVRHANLNYVYMLSYGNVTDLGGCRVQGLTRDLQGGIPKVNKYLLSA